MKSYKIILGTLAIAAILTGCAPKVVEPTPAESAPVAVETPQVASITYTNETYGFSVELPNTWKDYKVTEQKLNDGVPAFYFELQGEDEMESLFAVAVYTKAQFAGITEADDPITFNSKIAETDKYVFTAQGSQDNSEKLYPRRAEVQDIFKTFKTF